MSGNIISPTILFPGIGEHLNELEGIAAFTRGSRIRSATAAEDRYIVLSVKRDRRITAGQVANQFLAATCKRISP